MTALAPRPMAQASVHPGLARAVSHLDAWLQTMRGPDGYGGPIMHWWESNFLYTGAGFDWRYEGIIDGYRELYLRTHNRLHLEQAVLAAQDILPHQLPDGRFRNSSFQFGPVPGGTPHEAALCVALLRLAGTLQNEADPRAAAFRQAALHNLEGYWTGQLWNGQGFQDQPYKGVFVANKHATLMEALLEAQAQTGTDYGEYLQACVRVILGSQIRSGLQAGGTIHLGIGPSRLAIPIYTARTMNGLLSYHDRFPATEYERAVCDAASFLIRMLRSEGVAWGRYGDGRLALNPMMIAGAGDVLRFLLRVQARGLVEVSPSVERLIRLLVENQLPSGGLPTAHGFRAKGLNVRSQGQDLRDLLPVVGWVDKSFRALVLALPAGKQLPTADTRPYHLPVVWRGAACQFQETSTHFILNADRGGYAYRWTKGRPAPDTYAL